MAKRYFVKNLTGRDITEKKPGVGTFTIPANDRLEIHDLRDSKGNVRYPADKLADAIVLDFMRSGYLKVEVEGAERPAIVPPVFTSPEEFEESRSRGGKRKKNQ